MLPELPIQEIIPEIKSVLKSNNVLLIQAPPGAGKSTILPIQLIEEPWLKGKKILMLEPRKLAAKSVANRMASLMNEAIGNTLGYRVRFENRVSKETKIEVLTEGILTRMLQQDNTLEGVGVVIFDEFHERSLQADLALALCREVQQVLRTDLKIIIMSATLDGDKLSSLLDGAPVLTSQGRQYPITLKYTGIEEKVPLHINVAKAIRRAILEEQGDILTFLPGVGEILRTQEVLERELFDIKVLPLYGDLPQQKQQEALTPNSSGKRKIVLATAIAETSLTIEGIRIVIDSGFSRVPRFDPKSGLTRLETIKITKDSADQRAGRAGRQGPGVCYRLWSEGSQQYLIDKRTPEILEADLSPMMLELSQWGVQKINSLTWLTLPPSGAVNQAMDLLNQLEALEQDKITEKGKEMLKLPTHPRIAHMLLEGKAEGNIKLATDIAALLEERDPLPKDAGANFVLRVEALRNWRNKERVNAEKNSLERIERLAQSWRKIFNIEIENSTASQGENVGKLLASAYPERIAKKKHTNDLRYRLANGKTASLHEHDPLHLEPWLSIAHLDAGSNEGRIFLAAPLNPDHMIDKMEDRRVVRWDSQKGILIGQRETRLGDILVEYSPLENIPEEEKAKVLCDVIKSEGLGILGWTEDALDFQARVMSISLWRTSESWPDLSNNGILKEVNNIFAPYLLRVKRKEDFLKLDMLAILTGLLSWEESQKLEVLAPSKIKVPSGSYIKLQYNLEGSPPVLSVRLQEMFGLLETPSVNEGKMKVLLHLLSPGYRPVQVTQDLKSFWQNTYPEVRKELRVRYQKHSWPEDPWTAEAVRGAKKKY